MEISLQEQQKQDFIILKMEKKVQKLEFILQKMELSH